MSDDHMTETLRLRTAAMHRVQRSNDQLRRECLDREATEQDVRARLADAEKALDDLRGRVEDLAFVWSAKADDSEAAAISRKGMIDEPQLRAFATVMRRRAAELRAALDGKP